MITLGIDPGKSGAMAIIYHSMRGSQVLHAEPLPFLGDELDISQIIVDIKTNTGGGSPVRAVIEKVGAMPGQGVVSMFSFGKIYGELRGMLKALRLPFVEPRPQEWKKVVLHGTAKDKDAAIAHVTRLYTEVELVMPRCRKPHDGIAEAVCLAEYGRRMS